ncbi:uncharacterized protein LOC118198080 isoform X2 [Stegodyphus dumicola]|nr:uncharacterized protein LOC118198080 isoform X2 [Stegodyphus dumicola]
MLLILCLIWTLKAWRTASQEDAVNTKGFEAILQDAVLDVYSQHMDEMSHIFQPPEFSMPSDFMRSFLPGSGIGNREELIIESIKPLPVFDDMTSTQWRYKRFNNTDYILAVSQKTVLLSQIDSSIENYFVLSKDKAVLNFVADHWSIVIDVAIYIRMENNLEVLYVAILTQNTQTSFVYVYEVMGDSSFRVSLFPLGIGPAVSEYSARKLAFVQSDSSGSLLVLISTPDVSKWVYQQRGRSGMNHYIEVYYPSAIDLVTFTVHGHGYVAVTNYTTCEIFKLDRFVKSHMLFDRLVSVSTNPLLDVEYFRLGFNHYLALVGTEKQYLYIWKSAEFSLKQEFNVPSAQQLYAAILPTCRDDVVLFVVTNSVAEILVFSGKSESFVKPNAVIPSTFNIMAGSVTSFAYKHKIIVLFRNSGGLLQVFAIETSLESIRDPYLAAGDKVSRQMKAIQKTLKDQASQIQNIQKVLKNAVRSEGDQTITAYQTFEDLSVTGGTVVKNVLANVKIEWENSDLTLEEYKRGTMELEKAVEELEKWVEEMDQIIPDVVRIDEDSVISGTKVFTGDVSGTSIAAVSLNLDTVNGIDLPRLQKSLYRLDKPQMIEGILVFPKPLVVTGDLIVEGKVNGLDFSEDIMTTNTVQTSHATMVFENKLIVRGNLDVTGKINDIDFGNEVVTLAGNHEITGKKTFLNGIIADNVETKVLDGVDIDDLYNRAFTKSGKQTVPGTMTFNGGLQTNNIILHGFLNGYNVSELAESIVRIDKPAIITGHKTFLDDVTILGALTVHGTVNGLKIPEDLFLTDIEQDVQGTKEFRGTVTAYDVSVTGTVDGLKIPDDIVTLSKDEEIYGTVFFEKGIHVKRDIIVEGLVDDVDISELAKMALKLNETSTFENAIFHGPVTVTGDVKVGGTVNNVNLKELVKDIVFKEDLPIVINAPKHFKKVHANKVNLEGMINGFNITVDFMRVRGEQTINGTTIFKQPVTFNSISIANGMINDFRLSDLYQNRLTLIIEDQIVDDIEFSDHIIVTGDLTVAGTINGLSIPEDVVLMNSFQPISNKHFLGTVTVDNLIIQGDAEVSGLFGGINLTQFYNERLTLSGDQEIEGDISIINSTVENLEISGLINGINIQEFARNVMSKTKDQIITASKEFSGQTIVYGPITTKEGINGVNLKELDERAVSIFGDNIITAPLEFGDVTVGNMWVSGKINGINLTRLDQDSLKKSGLQHVTGVNIFKSGFHVEGDINADTVNGIIIGRDLLLKTPPQTITGMYTVGSVGIAGDLIVSGVINGLDLSEVAPNLARTDQETVIESNITFVGPIRVFQNLDVKGLVNGIDLEQIYKEVLLKTGDQVIEGPKVIRGNVTISGDMDLGFVNGIEWKKFLDDIVRTNIPQTIKAPKTFKSDVAVIGDVFVNGLAEAGLINGRDLRKFLENAVFIDTPANITGLKIFKSDVEVTGDMDADLINGLRLKTDVITLRCTGDGPQVITGQKTFANVTAFGDIYVDETVNTYKLKELYDDTLFIDGNQTVSGAKTLQSEVIFKKDFYPDTVNGLMLERDLVTLHTDQEISGPLTFNSDVFVEKDVHVAGLVNGVNLTELALDAVYLETEQTIEGSYHLERAVVHSDVDVRGTVNDIDLIAFDQNVTEFWKEVSTSLEVIQSHTKDNCELANHLQEALSKSYYALDSFSIHQEFTVPATYVYVKDTEEIRLVYLNELAGNASMIHAFWDSSLESFVTTDVPVSTSIAKSSTYKIGNLEIEIQIGVLDDDSRVLINGLSNELPTGFKDASVSKWRSTEAMIAVLFPKKAMCEVYKVLPSSAKFVVMPYGSVSVGKEATSVEIFEIANSLYLAISNLFSPPYTKGFSKIYGKEEGEWRRIQNIAIAASTHVKHFLHRNFHYLAFTNIASVYETRESKSVQVYRNSGTNEMLFSLFEKIPFDDAQGLEIFEFGSLSDLFLATWNETIIQIFNLRGESGFKASVTLHGNCIKDVKSLLIDQNVYLVAGQQNLQANNQVHAVLYRGLTQGSLYSPRNLTCV